MSRRLRPDELELWQVVARTADRLPSKLTAPQTIENTPASVSPKPKKPGKKTEPLPSFSIGSKGLAPSATRDRMPTLSERLRAAPVQMDSKSYRSMQRGKLKPEGRIDLHGMTLSQAHPALVSFILSAQRSGKRLVLVITGKGGKRADPSDIAPQNMGALKRQVPLWLGQAPVNHIVMQVSEAHLRHGGTGAYYVYLRRTR